MIKDWLNKMFGETSVSVSWNQQYMNDLVRDWQDDLNKALEFVLVDGGFEQIQLDAMKVIGMSGWEYLAEDTKAKFIKAVEILESPETIAELKGIGVSATELFKFSDWESFTSEQRFSFLKSIKNAFGSNEAIEAAKAAGINIGTLVSQGLNSSDPKIKKEAQDWQKIIQDNAGKKVTVPVEANKDKVSKAGKNAKNWFTTALGKKFTTAVEATKASITKLKNDVNNAVGQNKVVKPTVDPQLASGFVTNLSTKIKDSIKSAVSKANISIPVKLQTKVTQMEYASGGFPTAGQLFIAREAGAEMVGSIGNRTAVANNDQIVAGVSSGVAAANEEQNALLRKQNQLLSAILAKTGNGGMQASSAMGRVIQQSLEMYTAVTGG